MRISTNIPGMISRRNLSNINNQLKTSIERLSSGFRINSAADDPQGLAISQRLRTVISSYEKNLENTQGGITMMQTADGNMDSLSTIISRIRDLTVLSASGDKTDEDRYMYQVEVNTLMEEYTSIVANSEYNGIKLLDGSL
ncbi:flagellin FliC, partial [bacterium]|nr:flagellin FliC [bacterium]